MKPEIPLEILGLLGPILSWVEGAQSQAVPRTWAGEPTNRLPDELGRLGEPGWAASVQERGWLLNELPTFSLDNVDEVVGYSRGIGTPGPGHDRWRPSRSRVSPPAGYDLWNIFETLAERYLVWNGGKVAIRAGRMVELHELGLRMPLSFVVCHVHARAVAAGEQCLSDVAGLPESTSLLPSNAQGLRTVIRRGLSEGHLHLNSIHATEIAWADHILKPLRHKPRGFEVVEWRLLRLARAAARTLALATAAVRANIFWNVTPEPEDHEEDARDCHGEAPRTRRDHEETRQRRRESPNGGYEPVLGLFDAMYFATTSDSMEFYEERFKRQFRETVGKITPVDLRRADQWPRARRRRAKINPSRGRLGLLHWLDPWRQTDHWLSEEARQAYRNLTSPLEREECLAALHLAAHLALVEAPRIRLPEAGGADMKPRGSSKATKKTVGKPPRWAYSTPAGRFLHRALFRYLVCQTHHWQLAVQQGRTTGLRQFKRYFDSNQRYSIEPTAREKADSVLRRARDWRGLRVLEGRVGPPKRSADLMPWLEAFAAGARDGRVEKMGLVVHFIKEPERKRPQNAVFRARFAELRSDYRRQAFRLFRILERASLTTPFIVGIDAANLELATPPEVFAAVFRFLRDRPIELRDAEALDLDAWRVTSSIREVVERRRLGMTYHVGEEFRHLLSGLRAIDEVLEFLAPKSGDRIGHGIALGLDPEVWLEQVGRQALVPKQEWLDTLVWVHQLLGAGHDALGCLRAEDKIEHLGRELYLCDDEDSRRSITPLLFRDVWQLRQLDPEMIELDRGGAIELRPLAGDDSASWRWNHIMRRMVQEVRKKVGSNSPNDLLSRYWYSPMTRILGEELTLVDMEKDADLWLAVCEEAQKRMQDRVAERQVAVEVNPSSNRVIGPMSRYADHHIFKLTLDDEGQWKRRLRVTVNTDNPGTANTSLTHEYYLLGEALMSTGKSESEVVEWLEGLRESGEDSSFLRQLPKPSSRAMKLLVRQLRQRRPALRELRDREACLRELWRTWPKTRSSESCREERDFSNEKLWDLMGLTQTQCAMVLLLGEWLPSPALKKLEDRVREGRRLLQEVTGQDFGFDLERWHQHLLHKYPSYQWKGRHLVIWQQILLVAKDPGWLAAKEALATSPRV